MKMLKNRKKRIMYSGYQKWIATNLFVAAGASGYRTLRKIFTALPSIVTVKRCLQKMKTSPGVTSQSARMVRIKVSPKNEHEQLCFLLIDEMSLQPSLKYDIKSDKIVGYCDKVKGKCNLAKHAMVVMVVGLTKRWKYPLGYYFCENAMSGNDIKEVISESISVLENEGFDVKGITSDQGSNFQKVFREMGATPSNPEVDIEGKPYLICKDAPHLLKSARNFLYNKEVHVPGFTHTAKWSHITTLHGMVQRNSLRMAPKLTKKKISNLKFFSKMKVNYAAQVLSNTVAASLETLVEQSQLPEEASATSIYCKNFNDLFDVLNSSSVKTKVPMRKPLLKDSRAIEFLEECLTWLEKLKECNKNRPVQFIDGFRMTINVVLRLRKLFTDLNLPCLRTRRICQDPLEVFFGKVRQVKARPDPYEFSYSYVKICCASLIKGPIAGNCEDQEEIVDAVRDTIGILDKSETCYVDTVALELNEDEGRAALEFEGPTCVGSAFDSVDFQNGLKYYAGYIVRTLAEKHRKLGINLEDCHVCSQILGVPDEVTHRYVYLREYTSLEDFEYRLKYCSDWFVDVILICEKIFLYVFDKYRHENKIKEIVSGAIMKYNNSADKFCTKEIYRFLVDTFVRARLFQSVREVNAALSSKGNKDKMLKLNII